MNQYKYWNDKLSLKKKLNTLMTSGLSSDNNNNSNESLNERIQKGEALVNEMYVCKKDSSLLGAQL